MPRSKNGGVKFDIIGFDACLMATLETALVAEQYGDYLIASEAVEPGTGWYYTNWLSALSENPAIDSLDLGKQIIDDYVKMSGNSQTTLSIDRPRGTQRYRSRRRLRRSHPPQANSSPGTASTRRNREKRIARFLHEQQDQPDRPDPFCGKPQDARSPTTLAETLARHGEVQPELHQYLARKRAFDLFPVSVDEQRQHRDQDL